MADKNFTSVWEMYDSLYNRGMSKGKNKFRNWVDNILHPEKNRFSLGHLWHGKEGPHHFGEGNLFSFKKMFGVKEGSSLKKNSLIKDILSKGKKLHDYTKYNKANPDEWKDSESNLMSVYEHEGKKYAHFVGKNENNKGQNYLYELKNSNLNFEETLSKVKSQGTVGMNLEEAKEKMAEFLKVKNNIFHKGSIMEAISDRGSRRDAGITLTKEAKGELTSYGQKQEKKKKGLKAGVAIAEDMAYHLQRAWEKSYRG